MARVVVVCKGSVKSGLGHVMRSRTFAKHASRCCEVHLIVIGDHYLDALLSGLVIKHHLFRDEAEAIEAIQQISPDLVFLDMLECSDEFFAVVKRSEATFSLSPIFSHLNKVDLVFHRTSVLNPRWSDEGLTDSLRCGLQYNIIRESCESIPTEVYLQNAQQFPLAVAISMGGTDASNNTLKLLQAIRDIPRPILFWVLLGEGYGHSYEELVEAVKQDTNHEIILAKTSDSMWRIMRNCALAILAGGTVTYESAFAGLPSINLFHSPDNYFLVEELAEKGACLSAGYPMDAAVHVAAANLEFLESNRDLLVQMHTASKDLIDKSGAQRIIAEALNHYWSRQAS
ncbi:hypothetical protein [Bremerella volcania]|uniref:hypothetical protein n=1 Tax=Bremerella volcania TaxID=2527984 RepID=UPI0011A490DB|nr:hypothetical protein [Bremerella volcania]